MAGKGKPVGTIFAELALDTSEYTKGQREILASASKTALSIEKNFKTLGQKSDTIYNAMRQSAENAFNGIKHSANASFADIERAQRAYADRVKRINRDQYGDSSSMAGALSTIQSKWLGIAAAVASVTVAVKMYANQLKSAIQDIDSLKIGNIQIAAQVATMQGSSNVEENYKKAYQYAESLNETLQQVDAKSFANFEILQRMNQALVQGGVLLDQNNKSQMDAFVSLSNAIAAATVGQDQQQQAYQEIRGLLSGEVSARNRIAAQIDTTARKSGLYKDGLKEIVKLSKEHGDLLERLKPFLVGMDAASGDIEKTWEAISTSFDTVFRSIRREVFKDFYSEAITWGGKFVAWLRENKSEIAAFFKDINRGILTGGPTPGAIGGALLAGYAERQKALQSNQFITDQSGIGMRGKIPVQAPIIPPGAPEEDEKAAKKAQREADKAARLHEKYLKDQADEAQRFRDLQEDLHQEAEKEEADSLKRQVDQVRDYNKQKADLESQWTDDIHHNTLSQVEYAKWAENEKYQAYKQTYSEDQEMLDLNEARHKTAMDEIAKSAKKTFSEDVKTAMMGWASDWSKSLNDMLWGSKITFQGILEEFAKMLTQMVIQKKLVEPMFEFVFGNEKTGQKGFDWAGTASSIGSVVGSIFSMAAQGNVFAGAGIGAYSNSIVDRPVVFPFAKGIGIMGEGKNPEGVLPLKRTRSGNLGVEAEGMGSNSKSNGVIIHMENPVFQDLATQRKTFEQIATVVAAKVAPGAVIRSYKNDGEIRSIIRGGK